MKQQYTLTPESLLSLVGDPSPDERQRPPEEMEPWEVALASGRLMQKIKVNEGGCWEWTGGLERDGYAKINVRSRNWSIHRLSWVLVNGPIPEGMEIDHLCRNRKCANPKHLEPVTRSVNNERAKAARAARTHCRNGHLLQGFMDNHGCVLCKACKRERMKKYRHTRRMSIAA